MASRDDDDYRWQHCSTCNSIPCRHPRRHGITRSLGFAYDAAVDHARFAGVPWQDDDPNVPVGSIITYTLSPDLQTATATADQTQDVGMIYQLPMAQRFYGSDASLPDPNAWGANPYPHLDPGVSGGWPSASGMSLDHQILDLHGPDGGARRHAREQYEQERLAARAARDADATTVAASDSAAAAATAGAVVDSEEWQYQAGSPQAGLDMTIGAPVRQQGERQGFRERGGGMMSVRGEIGLPRTLRFQTTRAIIDLWNDMTRLLWV